MSIKNIEIPGDKDGSVGRFVLTQVDACKKDLLAIPTNERPEIVQMLYSAHIAQTILRCINKAVQL